MTLSHFKSLVAYLCVLSVLLMTLLRCAIALIAFIFDSLIKNNPNALSICLGLILGSLFSLMGAYIYLKPKADQFWSEFELIFNSQGQQTDQQISNIKQKVFTIHHATSGENQINNSENQESLEVSSEEDFAQKIRTQVSQYNYPENLGDDEDDTYTLGF